MLAFTSTCGRKLYSHLHSQMSRHSLRSALCLSAKLPTQAWSPTLVKAQQTGFPKMFLKKTFWDVLIARFFRFLRTQSFHLSNNLTQFRIHFNITYQVAEFKLGLIFSMCLQMSSDLFLKLNIRRSI